MTQKTRRRGFLASAEGVKKLKKAKSEKGYSYPQIAQEAYVDIEIVRRLFNPHWGNGKYKIGEDFIEAIAKALDLEPPDIVDGWYPPGDASEQQQNSPSADLPDWQGVCHAMLEKQQQSQRLRRKATEMGFEVNVHVPLGLVKRKQQQRRDENVELDQIYQLEREVIARTYQHDEFLTEVIGQSQSSKNKHIAIIGEPGTGKTTLLGAIASFIQSKTEDLLICISLASLQGRTLEDYLLKTWLFEAIGLMNPEVVVTPEIKNELIKQFRKGGVWLLLDGVDEMGADSPVHALTTIQQQLTDWLGQARVVLTCRVNVWDASVNNTLTGFNTYKTHEFTYEQIDHFIQEWFACAADVQRGKQLQAKLKETERERIRELVKNPLRLALLCQTFYLDKQGDLPETKAALYERFTRYFYEWKPSIHPVETTTQTELHQALGKLAIAGINSNARFRLRESLARQEMGERLFNLACDRGWLNLVDRDAENNDESVYAFFHANFQEYFAALAIDDWRFFLNHATTNPAQVTYRIFDLHWKEVILLWLGRAEVEKAQKDTFVCELLNFGYECELSQFCFKYLGYERFYGYRAYFLAAAGIVEFKDCVYADEIVRQLCKWSFGYFQGQREEWLLFQQPIQEGARAALGKSDRPRAIKEVIVLIDILATAKNSQTLNEAVKILSQIAYSDYEFVLEHELIVGGRDSLLKAVGFVFNWATEFLGEIDPENPKAIKSSTEQPPVKTQVKFGKVERLMRTTQGNAAITSGVSEAIRILTALLQDRRNEHTLCHAAWDLGQIDPGNEDAIKALSDLLDSLYSNLDENSKDICKENFCQVVAESLLEIDPGNPNAITALVDLRRSKYIFSEYRTFNTPYFEPERYLPTYLKDSKFPLVVAALWKWRLNQNGGCWTCYDCWFQLMWHCAQNMTYLDFYQALHSQLLTLYPETPDDITVDDSPTVQALNNQFTDIASQLQSTDKTYCIVINAQALEGETDTSAIAQELCNQIYLTAFPDELEIPEVSNAPQLKRLIPKIKKQLQKQNLALILDKCELNQAQVTFCRKLSDVLHIAWITNQPLEPPLRGFLPNQPNLLSAIQSWIDEID